MVIEVWNLIIVCNLYLGYCIFLCATSAKCEKWLGAIRSRDEYLQASTAGDSVFVVNPTWSKNKHVIRGQVVRMTPTVTSGLDKLLSIQSLTGGQNPAYSLS